jgi:hypothetical protein
VVTTQENRESSRRAFAVAAVGLIVQSASAMASDPRPELKDVSAVRIANYGTPSTVIQDREQVSSIVHELRQLRTRTWRRADTKLSCYATLVLLSGTRTVALFRVRPELVVERPQGKGQSSYSLAIGQGDLPRIGTLLTGIPPAKDCR